MLVQYGSIIAEVDWRYPTRDIFVCWLKDFLALSNVNKFDVYLAGSFVNTLNGESSRTVDVDIVLTGHSGSLVEIRDLLREGCRLGIEEYSTFFDVLWFDRLVEYSKIPPNTTTDVKIYMISDRWIIDGEVRKVYDRAEQICDGLWELETTLPTKKQRDRMAGGHQYYDPLLLNPKAGSRSGGSGLAGRCSQTSAE